MLTQRESFDYTPHSRPKKYFLIRPQLSTSVKPSTRPDRYQWHYVGQRKFRFLMIGMSLSFASLYLLLYLGVFDPIYTLFF